MQQAVVNVDNRDFDANVDNIGVNNRDILSNVDDIDDDIDVDYRNIIDVRSLIKYITTPIYFRYYNDEHDLYDFFCNVGADYYNSTYFDCSINKNKSIGYWLDTIYNQQVFISYDFLVDLCINVNNRKNVIDFINEHAVVPYKYNKEKNYYIYVSIAYPHAVYSRKFELCDEKINDDGYVIVKGMGKHRLIGLCFINDTTNNKERIFVDHINQIRTDYRITNLRWATYEENNRNRTMASFHYAPTKYEQLPPTAYIITHVKAKKGKGVIYELATNDRAYDPTTNNIFELHKSGWIVKNNRKSNGSARLTFHIKDRKKSLTIRDKELKRWLKTDYPLLYMI